MPTPKQDGWILEIVRGRETGRRYPLVIGEVVLGNAPGGGPAIDLADQEGGSPRRMAGQQACLRATAEALSIHDLESPGGTFVNRQRLLAGQVRTLHAGDIIQLGGVQLEVKRAAAAAAVPAAAVVVPAAAARVRASAAPGALSVPFTMAGGAACRTWNDFLIQAAQRWSTLREELTSGRLADHLRRIQRADLAPRPDPRLGADERLDQWLARLPATVSSAPELDVHPASVVVKVVSGGGLVRQTLRITNVGYRLLKGTVRVEPSAPGSLRLGPGFPGGGFTTIDQTEVPLEIELPEAAASAVLGTVVIESNGGTNRIEVRQERPPAPAASEPAPDDPTRAIDLATLGRPLSERLAAMPLARRLWAAPLALMAFRLLVMAAGFLTPRHSPAAAGDPQLSAVVLVLSAAGLLGGIFLALRDRTRPPLAPSGFAGALVGVFAAAVGFAFIESVESALLGGHRSAPASLALWALLGAALAGLSWRLLPARPGSQNEIQVLQ